MQGGPTSVVATDTAGRPKGGGLPAATPLVSGTTTVYPTQIRRPATTSLTEIETLVVTGPHRTHTLKDVIVYNGSGDHTVPSLSGNRLVYFGQTGTGHPAFFVYDVAKDTVTQLESWTPTSWVDVPAISGAHVVYPKPDGTVWRKDLTTGQSTELPDTISRRPRYREQLFASGDDVAAEFSTVDDAGQAVFQSEYALGTGGPSAPSHGVAGAVVSLSGSGAVVDADPDEDGGDNSYRLVSFDGHVTDLFDADFAELRDLGVPVPQVVGNTLAWIDDDSGAVEAAPVDITPAPPRMAGDTLAPTPANPDKIVWHAYVPYSESLTSCTVAVMHGASTVATLSCNKSEMALGVADVEWNGHVGSHHSPAGTYHYDVTAAGPGGGALDSAGTTAPVAGHFMIN